ncbi:MAG: glycosyltransferase family 2 protein [Candidatus Peribacteraceae bacterium]|nr:glycosyltransferase family 2 protein [Candidatus Peribacteraceae bacterium]
MDFTIVIPAFNEAQCIGNVLRDLTTFLRAHALLGAVTVVDDGSTDATAEEAAKVAGVHVISHPYNKGYGASIKTGVIAATTEWVLTYDADGQHTPDLIERLLPAMDDRNDLVIGKREGYKGPWIRQPGKMLLSFVASAITVTKIPDLNSGLRAFRRKVFLQYMHLFPNGFSLSTTSTVCYLHQRLNVRFVPITIQARKGKSTVRPRDAVKTFLLILRLITLFSPLRIFLPASFLSGIIALSILGHDLLADRNVSDSAVLLIIFSTALFFFGLVVDQVAAIRRELGLRSSAS